MPAANKDKADWPQPFPAEEYRQRRQRVADRLRQNGLDAMLVTNPADIYYLTGYDMIWFHLRFLTSCLVTSNGDEVQFFDYPGHTSIVETTPEIKHITWMTRESPEKDASVIASVLVELGLGGRKVAVQKWGYVPHARVMKQLVRALEGTAITVEDHATLVEEVRLYKSPLEIACMRKAAAIAETAMGAAREMIAPGVMETEIQATIMYSMMNNGGGDPAIRCMIGSGSRSGTHHSPAQHRQVGKDELVFVDFCAALHRYHVNLNRTFSTGNIDVRWHDLMDKSAGCIDEVVNRIGPGDKWSRVQEIADRYTDRQGIGDYVWFVGGYALGIAMPPDWVGEYWVKPRAGVPDRVLEPGMTFNFEGQFDDKEGWSGGSGAAYIDSLVMTDSGLEVLSTLPRNIVGTGGRS